MIGWCSGRQTLECNRAVGNQIYDCEVGHVFIIKQYQHRGIGRELWKIVWNDVLIRFCPKNFIVWSVDKEQAHQFYLSLGGIPIVERRALKILL
jgi:predicted acetyltransferase